MSEMTIEAPLPDINIAAENDRAARERLTILDQKVSELQARGDIKPATILNLSPFKLSLGSGLIPYEVPACPLGKPFAVHTVRTIRHASVYRGNEEFGGGMVRKRWDVNILLPMTQLMAFQILYMGETEDPGDDYMGGVVVFEGEWNGQKPADEVTTARVVYRKMNRILFREEKPLGELIKEAKAVMKRRCMKVIDEADRWFDHERTRANIQDPQRIWHDFALNQQWIGSARTWRNAHVEIDQRCQRCAQQYVSNTGVCKCGYVRDPFTAYMCHEIEIDHVRMASVKKNKEQWAKVLAEEALINPKEA